MVKLADGGKVIIKIDGDSKGFKSAMGGIGKIAGTAFKGVAIGATAATTAIGAIGTAAVKSFAEFEQLSGGVQKIFDEIDYAKIKKDADEAFKTMQISANQYLQLMTTVGANFASTLGDEKGYEVAKQGMKAITDFATGTGRSIDELSQKYQMITKSTSSYQSIADQFAGILPATSAEFLKQAQAAGILEEKYKKLTDVPMAEYQEAVTQMLAKGVNALGLTDNAANEAFTTLSGSLNMFKASLENLMTGLADPSQDLDVLMDNVINSATAVMDNLGPVVQTVLESLPTMISTLGTKLAQELPGLVNSILPSLADTASQLITALSTSLSKNAKSLGQTALSILMTLSTTFLDNLPVIIETALVLIITLAEGLVQALPELIPAVIDTVLMIVDTLLDNIDMLIDVAIDLIIALANGLIEALPKLMEKVPEIIVKLVAAIIENAPKLLTAGVELIAKLWDGLIQGYAAYFSGWGKVIYDNIIQPIKDKITEMAEIGKNIVEGLWNGIINAKDWLLKKIESFATTITQGIKDFFGIESPSKVMRDEVGKMITEGLAIGISKNTSKAIKAAKGVVEDVKNAFTSKEGFDIHSPSIFGEDVGYNLIAGVPIGIDDAKALVDESLDSLISDTKEKLVDEFGTQTSVFAETLEARAKRLGTTIESEKNKGLSSWVRFAASSDDEALKILNYIRDFRNKGIKENEISVDFVEEFDAKTNKLKNKYVAIYDKMGKQIWRKQQLAITKVTSGMLEREEQYFQLKEKLESGYYDNKEEREKEEAQESLKRQREYIEEERKMYGAQITFLNDLGKDVEELEKERIDNINIIKENIVNAYKEIAQEALSSIDEIDKAQEQFKEKLSDYGHLYETVKINAGDEVITYGKLADLSAQQKELEEYYDILMKVKERGSLPEGFFSMLRDMSIEEGMFYANALLGASDEEFNKYLSDYERKRKKEAELSELIYQDESEDAKKQFETAFEELTTEMNEYGEEGAKTWAKGFIEEIMAQLPQILAVVDSAFGNIIPNSSFAYAGAGAYGNTTAYYDNRSTTINAGNNASAHDIIEAQNQENEYQKHTKGWE